MRRERRQNFEVSTQTQLLAALTAAVLYILWKGIGAANQTAQPVINVNTGSAPAPTPLDNLFGDGDGPSLY
jgi:hypothetical protein